MTAKKNQFAHAIEWVATQLQDLGFSRSSTELRRAGAGVANRERAILVLSSNRKAFRHDFKVLLENKQSMYPRPTAPKKPAGPIGSPAHAERMRIWSAAMEQWDQDNAEWRAARRAADAADRAFVNALAVLKGDALLDFMADGEKIRAEVLGTRRARKNPPTFDIGPKERVILRVLGKKLDGLGFQHEEGIAHFLEYPDEPVRTFLGRIKSDVGPGGHGWQHVGPGAEPKWPEWYSRFGRDYDDEDEARDAFRGVHSEWKEEAQPYFDAAKLVDEAMSALARKNPGRRRR